VNCIDVFWPIAQAAEGVRFMPYDDSTGKPVYLPSGSTGYMTIGCGTKLPIDREEAFLLFSHRAAKFVATMNTTGWWLGLDVNRQAAMLEIAYNSGSIYSWPRLIHAVGLKDWPQAHNEVLFSKAANDPRLSARYQRIANTILTGEL
jgi:GH24 family phage-related lysozyme (muramidase)